MTNFDFLLSDPQLTAFGEVAVAAEKIYAIDPAACVLNCRRAVEFAVKWMYSVDSALAAPQVHPPDGKRRRPHRKEDHQGAGPVVSGKPLVLHGLCGLLLQHHLHPRNI